MVAVGLIICGEAIVSGIYQSITPLIIQLQTIDAGWATQIAIPTTIHIVAHNFVVVIAAISVNVHQTIAGLLAECQLCYIGGIRANVFIIPMSIVIIRAPPCPIKTQQVFAVVVTKLI